MPGLNVRRMPTLVRDRRNMLSDANRPSVYDTSDDQAAKSAYPQNWRVGFRHQRIRNTQQDAKHETRHPSWPRHLNASNHKANPEPACECGQQCCALVGKRQRQHRGHCHAAEDQAGNDACGKSRHGLQPPHSFPAAVEAAEVCWRWQIALIFLWRFGRGVLSAAWRNRLTRFPSNPKKCPQVAGDDTKKDEADGQDKPGLPARDVPTHPVEPEHNRPGQDEPKAAC